MMSVKQLEEKGRSRQGHKDRVADPQDAKRQEVVGKVLKSLAIFGNYFSGPFQKEIQHLLQPAELASSPFGPRGW